MSDEVDGGWRCDTGGDEQAQVYPVCDLREHIATGVECWCHPQIIDGIVIHNAMDGREQFERGERKPS